MTQPYSDALPCNTPEEIRALPIEGKIEVFRGILTDVCGGSEVRILNLYRLVNSYNVFDDTFFQDPNSYLCDISEFVDVKNALAPELEAFMLELSKWYLSILTSCDIPLTIEQDDSKRTIPAAFYGIFLLGSAPLMSSIMGKVDLGKIDMTSLYKVKEGFSVLSRLFGNHAMVGAFLEKL